MDDFFLNSLCCEGLWLHNYMIVKTYNDCVVEECIRCKDRQVFKNNGTNKHYGSYHMRSMLQPYQNRFHKEYPQAQ